MGAVVDITRHVPRLAFNRQEAAEAIGVCPNTFDKMVRDGVMPNAREHGGKLFWRVVEIDSAIADLPQRGERTKWGAKL